DASFERRNLVTQFAATVLLCAVGVLERRRIGVLANTLDLQDELPVLLRVVVVQFSRNVVQAVDDSLQAHWALLGLMRRLVEAGRVGGGGRRLGRVGVVSRQAQRR